MADDPQNDPRVLQEREITHPVTLSRADGTVNPEAVGWSRQPLHDCTLRGWGRNKRWEYWGISSDTHFLAVTYSSIDFLGILGIWFLDFETRQTTKVDLAVPGAIGVKLPDSVRGGDMSFDGLGATFRITEEPGGTRVRASGRAGRKGEKVDADVFIEMPEGHETLSVVVPWTDKQFQYTSKHNTRPATGTVTVGDKSYRFGADNNSFGCLDFGRGRWPHKIVWNWGSGSGRSDGHLVGLQFGGKWTDGTGSNENALCIDGRLHKISEELIWDYSAADWSDPWRITTPVSNRVDLTFTPFYEKHGKMSIGVLGNETNQCFGHWSGTVVTDDGETIVVNDLFGWAEEVHMVW